ncbi:MAG: response regulator transcription factor [Nitrospirae bacterium]|nr:response regulator transcription factor [Nitrospirota bacterium]
MLTEIDHLLKDILQKRSLPAILVIESTGRIVFASEEGQRFLVESVSTMERNGYGQNGSDRKMALLPDSLRNFAREVCKQVPANGQDQQAPARRAILFQTPAGHHYIVMAVPLAKSSASGKRRLILLVVQRVGQRNNINPDRLGQVYGLTKREQEVVTRLVRGDSNKEIAASLHIQEYTVKDHLKHIMAKCQVDSRVNVITKVLDL